MRIQKEGYKILIILLIILLLINSGLFIIIPQVFFPILFSVCSLIFFILCVGFFRVPARDRPLDANNIYAPADGRIVVIENTFEEEYYKDERIQVSIFMSVLNIHVNWTPIGGSVKYKNHIPGKYYAAWNPKSSKNNERTSLVVEEDNGFSVLVRQIAGILARRIITYPKSKTNLELGDQIGFIKFGSRVDLFLPLNTQINVDLNQKVKGNSTIIGKIGK